MPGCFTAGCSLPAPPGYELHALNIPSRGVSGDYYEVIDRLAGRECALHVVDVSGKGIAASLLTASVEALAVALRQTVAIGDEAVEAEAVHLARRAAEEGREAPAENGADIGNAGPEPAA